MEAKIRPVTRVSLSDGIVEQITDLIARGVLKRGERLPAERELCKQCGVGRTSLREALRPLCVVGILEVRPGEGTFVSEHSGRYLEKTPYWGMLLNPKEIEDLIETRIILESHTASLASQRATPENIAEIEHAIQGMELSVDQADKYTNYDLQFHLSIARASQNEFLYHLLGMTRGHLQKWIKKSLEDPLVGRLAIQEHKKILKAIRDGDADKARSAMTQHIISRSAALPRLGRAK